jgi:hypothetical protein
MASAAQTISDPSSRVIFTEGGKGGVGKTAFTTGLVEWFDANQIPYTLLDLDTENKARGSLTHYFRDKTRKVNIHTSEGLDSFIDVLDEGPPIVIADMGAGSGQVAHKWFEAMYESVREIGVAFTAIGIITPDPASVESVLSWAHALQHRVDYLIVKMRLPSLRISPIGNKANRPRSSAKPSIHRKSPCNTACRNSKIRPASMALRWGKPLSAR